MKHLRTHFKTHLQETFALLPPLWQRLGQKVLFDPRLLRFTHDTIVVGTNLRNHRVAFVTVMQLNSLLDLLSSNLGLSELEDTSPVKSL